MKPSKSPIIWAFLLVLLVSPAMNGCKTKEGCGLEEKYGANLESTKKGKSNLFNKKQRKKMKRG